MGRQKNEFKKCEAEYIKTNKSYAEIAKKYNLSLYAVQKAGSRGKWSEKRKAFREKTSTKAIEKMSESAAEKLNKLADAAEKAADVITETLENPKQFKKYIVSEGSKKDFKSVEKEFEKTDTRAVRDIVSALKELTGVMRDLYGLPTVNEQRAYELNREKLDIVKDAANAETDGEEAIKVIYEGENYGD